MIVGIDLGTTNSLVAVWQDGAAKIIPNALNSILTPSLVGLDEKEQIIIGEPAKYRLITHPDKTAANFKRYMGTNRTVNLGKKRFRPEELSAFVLKSLKADAEAFLGATVTEAIITVPAYFNDNQRKATKIAGQLAGLKVERLLNEPTAASLAYGLQNRETDSRFLVFDLGGGTFDVSILELFDDIMEVHASAGDNFLGGEDFSHCLGVYFVQQQLSSIAKSFVDLPDKLREKVRAQAEHAKCLLSQSDKAEMSLGWEDQEYREFIDTRQLEKLSEHLLSRLSTPIQRALRDARIRSKDLDEIVMVGGATRMPLIRKLVTKLFKRFPASNINPDEVVVVGAAVQAGLKTKDQALNDVVMTDVCPYTMGVEICEGANMDSLQSGHYLPIIERNSFIPVSRVERVCTTSDQQQQLEVKVFQGESPMVKDNIFLGALSVDVPGNSAGKEAADIRFTYDINGLLEVEVTIVSTEQKQRTVIEENPGIISKQEIEARFKALEKYKIHPREQMVNQVVITRAERLYQELLGDKRRFISSKLAEFHNTLIRQDSREIELARDALKAQLDKLEGMERDY